MFQGVLLYKFWEKGNSVYPLLYKYCKFSEKNYDLNNLNNDTLFFNSPTGYNDPYEGVIAVSIVDIIEAFFMARVEKAENTNISTNEIETIFAIPKLLHSIDNGRNSEIENVRTILFSMLSKAITHTECNPDVLMLFRLFNDDTYLRVFPQISNASLPAKQYESIIRDASYIFDDVSELSKEFFIELLLSNYTEKHKIVNSLRQKTSVIIPIYLVDAINNTPFKCDTYEETLKEYNQIALETFEIARKMPGKIFKTTCLSENSKSILMWSHYANQHEGFCIEYDFNRAIETNFPIDRLAKVFYSDSMPKLNIQSLIQVIRKKFDHEYVKDPNITQLTSETCLEAIITKNTVWQYEEEWRIILDNFSDIQIDKIPYATKIIMGINISEKDKAELLRIANTKKPSIPVYQAYLLPDKYEIDYYPVT